MMLQASDICLGGPVQTDRIATRLVGRKNDYAITRRTNIAKRRAGSGLPPAMHDRY
jgi:hypothetical protein